MTRQELLSHHRFVRDLARRLVRDGAGADDVAQDAMLAALTNPPRAGGRPRAWLATVVRNLARGAARSERRRAARERQVARPEAVPAADDAIERLAWHRRVVEAVLALEEPYRRTVVLRHYDSHPPREVARRMGVPVATVRTRLYRAYAQLRERLGREGDWRPALFALMFPGDPRGLPLILAMSTKTKITAAAVAALALIGGLLALGPLSSGPARAPREALGAGAARTGQDEPESAPAPPPASVATIDRDLDLHGIVTDSADAPVEGARIESLFAPWERGRIGLRELAAETLPGPGARSGPDGAFALRLRRGDVVDLRVSAPGFATACLARRQAGERVKVVLARGASLVVTVRDPEGEPIAGARATLRPGLLSKNRDLDILFATLRAVTGPDGRCAFGDLGAPMEARLEVEHDAYAWTEQVVAFREGEETAAELVLRRGTVVRGVVLDAETRTPVEGAEIGIGPLPRKAVRTGRDGWFTLRGFSGRTLDARAKGHALARILVESWEPLRYRQMGAEGFERRETPEIEVLLARGATAQGRVLDPGGEPLPGALVAATGSGAFGLMDPRATRTDADGRFLLDALQPLVQTHVLVVLAPGHGRLVLRFAAPGPAERDLGDLVLPPAAVLAGQVTGPRGEPVPRVRLVLRGGSDDRLLPEPLPERLLWWGNTDTRFTDDLGRFAFPDLAPGSYELAVRPDEGPAVVRTVVVQDDVRDLDVRLEYAHDLTVRVLDAQAQPVAGAPLSVRYGRETVWTESDENGTARVSLPAPADRVRVAGPRWGLLPVQPVEVEAGAREVTVTVRRASAVSGTVVDADGRPVGGVTIASVCAGERIGLASADAQGRFQATVPLGGMADLIVISDSVAGARRGVADGAAGIEIVVRPR